MSGVFYFINPDDQITYFMTGIANTFFTPMPQKATMYTLSDPAGPYSFQVDNQAVALNVSTQKDLEFRDIVMFQGRALQTTVGILYTPDDSENAVNGVRYKKAILCDNMLVGEEAYIEYLQFPNNRLQFRLHDEDPLTIAAAQTRLSEVYSDKVNPQKGQSKQQVVDTLDPIIKFSIYLLVIIAIFILFALTRKIVGKK